MSIGLSAGALVVSVVVFADNRVRQLREARLARRPALVLTWHPHDEKWVLENVGNGPALDVVVAQRWEGAWRKALRMPELATDGTAVVPRRWIEAFHSDPGLGVRYVSVTGERYFTRTAADVSTLTEGWSGVPNAVWAKTEPHWRYEPSRPRS